MSHDPQTSPSGKQEHLYKVLVIGDLGTGKTSIIKRYVHQFFSPHYRATVSTFFVMFSGSLPSHLFLSSLIATVFPLCKSHPLPYVPLTQ